MAFTSVLELLDSSTVPVEFRDTKIVNDSDRIAAEYLNAFFAETGVPQRHISDDAERSIAESHGDINVVGVDDVWASG